MRGFILEMKDKKTVAGVEGKGACVGITLSNKEGEYVLVLGGTQDGVSFPIWVRSVMKVGDSFTLIYTDIDELEINVPLYVDDISKPEERDQRVLEWYIKKKQELAINGEQD